MKTQLILDAIADKEELGVSDAELTERVISQAQQYGVSPQEFAQQLTQGGNLPALVADVRRSKALATVLERAHVTDASGRSVELEHLRLPRPEESAEAEAAEEQAAEEQAAEQPPAATEAGSRDVDPADRLLNRRPAPSANSRPGGPDRVPPAS